MDIDQRLLRFRWFLAREAQEVVDVIRLFRLTDEQTPRWKLNGAIYTEGYCKILPAYLTILWPLDVYPLHPFTLHTILLTIHPIPALVRGWCFC